MESGSNAVEPWVIMMSRVVGTTKVLLRIEDRCSFCLAPLEGDS